MAVAVRASWWGGAVLVAVHLLALGADFLAPYDFSTQFRDSAFAPPARIRVVDEAGRIHRPFVYQETASGERRRVPVRFFVEGAQRRLAGPLVIRTRLFGVEEPARVFLLGTHSTPVPKPVAIISGSSGKRARRRKFYEGRIL